MKKNEYDLNDFYFHDKDGYKLNPKGMSLICHYYRSKHNLSNLFVASNYSDLENIIVTLLAEHDNNRFGIVYRNIPEQGIGFSHKCAVIIQGNVAIVLDPFGGSGGNINFARMGAEQVAVVLKKLEIPNVKIYTSRLKVQSDASSCSTLCFLFLKEALRMGNELVDFLGSACALDEEDDLPPSLAKYTQNILYLDNNKNGLVNKYPNHNNYKIPIRSTKRQIETNEKIETLRQYILYHRNGSSSKVNPTAADRAAKHIQIINHYLDTLTIDELERILQVTSNPTRKSLLTIDKFPSIDPLIRSKNFCNKSQLFAPKAEECSDFDVFSFLADENEGMKTERISNKICDLS